MLLTKYPLVASAIVLLLGCAKGSTIADGGAGGEGGTSVANGPTNAHSTTAANGNPTTGAPTTSGPSGPSTTGPNGPSTTGPTTSGPTTTGPTTTAVTSVTVATSVTTGGMTNCDPQNPSAVCGANDHCFPSANGTPTCAGPIGGGTQYSVCGTPADCAGPFECVDVQDPFASPCCLAWCTQDFDCSGGDTCALQGVFVGATEYGFCYDGSGFGC